MMKLRNFDLIGKMLLIKAWARRPKCTMDRLAPTMLIFQLPAWWKTILISLENNLLFSGTQHNIYRTVLWTEGSLTFILCFCKNPCDKDWENFLLLFAKSLRMTHILSINFFLRVIFWIFHIIQNCFICRLSDSTLSEDSGIEPRTVATLVLTARRSNYSPRSHPKIFLKSTKLM